MTNPRSTFIPDGLLLTALYGRTAQLEDLHAMQLAKRRIPGGFHIAFQLATGRHDLVVKQLYSLAEVDPSEADYLARTLKASENAELRRIPDKLATLLDR